MEKGNGIKLLQYLGDLVIFLVLGFFTALYSFIFHLLWAGNVITVDMPYEEYMTMPFHDYIGFFLVGSIVLYLYIHFLFGNQIYKKIKLYLLTVILGFSMLAGVAEVLIMVFFFKDMPIEIYISQLSILIFSLLMLVVIITRLRGLFKKERNQE
ncbi:hypothetical protein [Aquibacillus kalidii]|uniref:hypothetical protein n=1 Tax=Aquibacillus kalidii TaxID=2762597 RepID=UPI0016455C0B|nr:hypothetical protein [Aquibacillus kalidii]